MTHLFAYKALLPGGWADRVRLEIAGGHIVRVLPGEEPVESDEVAGCVVPGLGNAHSHAFQRALAGRTEERSPAGRDSFWTWRKRMYELAARMTPDLLHAIAKQAYTEMLESGYTSVAEFHYLHRDPSSGRSGMAMFDALCSAAEETGIRMCYVPVLYERAGFDATAPEGHQAHFALGVEEFLGHHEDALARKSEGLTIGIGAHSLRAVSQDSLRQVAAAAGSTVPMHIHVAEQRREVEQCYSSYGRRPVRWLLENFTLGDNWCLVHATHMDEEETAALAQTGAVVALCPSTEANLGDGLFPLHDYLKNGGRIAIGSDSHISINPFEELRWLEYGQRLASLSRNVVSLRDSHVGSELFGRALEGGAMAAGQAVSGIAEGAPADLVALCDDDPMLAGHDDESRLDALVFSGYPLPVERVMVNGRWVVVDAMHIDRDRARADFAATLERIGTAT